MIEESLHTWMGKYDLIWKWETAKMPYRIAQTRQGGSGKRTAAQWLPKGKPPRLLSRVAKRAAKEAAQSTGKQSRLNVERK